MAKKNTPSAVPEENENEQPMSIKDAALAKAMASIDSQFGSGSIMLLGNKSGMTVEVTPTGILTVDRALGVGGLPKGRIVEIFGPESGGKTTLTLHIIAKTQQMGGRAAFVDVEHALDPAYATALGVNIDALLVAQPDYGEQALDIVESLIHSGAVDLIVVDSVAALTPKKEIEGEMGDSHVGLHARLMSQALRKLTAAANRNKCTVIFINQIREKIGVMFGSPETTTGGRALRFYASVRMEVRRTETVKKDGVETNNVVKVKVVKNKVAPPFKVAEGEIFFGEGFREESATLDVAVELGLVSKKGNWFEYEGEKLGNGRDAASNHLKANEDLFAEIDAKCREQLFS